MFLMRLPLTIFVCFAESGRGQSNKILLKIRYELIEFIGSINSEFPVSIYNCSDKVQVDLTAVNNKYKGEQQRAMVDIDNDFQKKLQTLTDEIQAIQV
jgi:hypothetical protein